MIETPVPEKVLFENPDYQHAFYLRFQKFR